MNIGEKLLQFRKQKGLSQDAVSKKLIKPLDPSTAPRYMKYVPIWA